MAGKSQGSSATTGGGGGVGSGGNSDGKPWWEVSFQRPQGHTLGAFPVACGSPAPTTGGSNLTPRSQLALSFPNTFGNLDPACPTSPATPISPAGASPFGAHVADSAAGNMAAPTAADTWGASMRAPGSAGDAAATRANTEHVATSTKRSAPPPESSVTDAAAGAASLERPTQRRRVELSPEVVDDKSPPLIPSPTPTMLGLAGQGASAGSSSGSNGAVAGSSVSMSATSSTSPSWAAVSEVGFRRAQEDRLIARTNIRGDPSCSFFAVIDGHGGDRAAEYVAKHLCDAVVHDESFPDRAIEALRTGFRKTEDGLMADLERSEHQYEGATAVAVLFLGRQVLVANVGDCRAVLVRASGSVVQLSNDHKPALPKERARIESCGGYVHDGRVQGVLAVSRVFGDRQLKHCVSAEPEIKAFSFGKDDIVVLASDGLWDVMPNTNVAQTVRSSPDLATVAQRLVANAALAGSKDNITVLVVDASLAGRVTYSSRPSPGGFSVPELPFGQTQDSPQSLGSATSTGSVFGAHAASPGQLSVFENRFWGTSSSPLVVSPSGRVASAGTSEEEPTPPADAGTTAASPAVTGLRLPLPLPGSLGANAAASSNLRLTPHDNDTPRLTFAPNILQRRAARAAAAAAAAASAAATPAGVTDAATTTTTAPIESGSNSSSTAASSSARDPNIIEAEGLDGDMVTLTLPMQRRKRRG